MLSIRCRKLKTKLDIVHESEKMCLGSYFSQDF